MKNGNKTYKIVNSKGNKVVSTIFDKNGNKTSEIIRPKIVEGVKKIIKEHDEAWRKLAKH